MMSRIAVFGSDCMDSALEVGFEEAHCCMPLRVRYNRVVGAGMAVLVALSLIPELELGFGAALFHVPVARSSLRSSMASSHSDSRTQHQNQAVVAEEPCECSLDSTCLEFLGS